MPIKVGDTLPSVDLYEGTPSAKVNTSEFQQGKVVITGAPGAYTPGCTKTHLPGYISDFQRIKDKGVDSIVAVAVNDPFVMAAWQENLNGQGKVRFLADTHCEFTKAIDLTLDATAFLGNVRSKRYAMVVENGVVTAINVEPDGTGLTCSLSGELLNLL